MAGLGDLAALESAGLIEVKSAPADLRFAGNDLTEDTINQIFTKWDEYDQDRSRPNYEGRNLQAWKNDNAQIRNHLMKLRSSGAPYERAIDTLKSYGFGDAEAHLILDDDKFATDPVMRNERYFSPGSKADEDVNRAVLHYSGFSPVLEGNVDNPQGTDIKITLPGGVTKMVDAQARNTPKGLQLGITQGDRGLVAYMARNPGVSLINAIKQRREQGENIIEDKLLHSQDSNVNPIMSRFMKGKRGAGNVKDFISSSNRSNARRIGQGHNPYNRERAYDYDLIDLDRARGILLPKTLNEINELLGEGSLQQFGQKSQIVLPNNFIKEELLNRENRMDPEVVRKLKGGMRVERNAPRRR